MGDLLGSPRVAPLLAFSCRGQLLIMGTATGEGAEIEGSGGFFRFFIFFNKIESPRNSGNEAFFGGSVVPNRLRRFAAHGPRKVI